MSNDEIEHVMETDEGYDHPESIVKAPKKKRTLSAEHLAKMREGRKRYLEAKRQKKLGDNVNPPEEVEEVTPLPAKRVRSKAPPTRKKRVRTVNNYYYQEDEEEESEEDSSTDEEIENNYYGGSHPNNMAGVRYV